MRRLTISVRDWTSSRIEKAGGEVIGLSFVVDLPDLGGGARLRAMGKIVQTLCAFEGH